MDVDGVEYALEECVREITEMKQFAHDESGTTEKPTETFPIFARTINPC
jgi:hypothetical protein